MFICDFMDFIFGLGTPLYYAYIQFHIDQTPELHGHLNKDRFMFVFSDSL